MSPKVVFWVKKRCSGVFWTGCEVADLKQRQKIFEMNRRNKIQSLVSPTDNPGDAPDCITEYGSCTCEYGHICHKSANFRSSVFPEIQVAFCHPGAVKTAKKECQPQNMANSAKMAKKSPTIKTVKK